MLQIPSSTRKDLSHGQKHNLPLVRKRRRERCRLLCGSLPGQQSDRQSTKRAAGLSDGQGRFCFDGRVHRLRRRLHGDQWRADVQAERGVSRSRFPPKTRKRPTATGTPLSNNGGAESMCGWCRDKWGLNWQITPQALTDAMAAGGEEAKRVFRRDDGDEEARRGKD